MKYRKIDRYKYQLMEDETLEIPVGWNALTAFIFLRRTTLTIRKGYCWDGCSGPTIDTESTMRAGLIHDALYQLMRVGKLPQDYKPHADALFKQLLIEAGCWRLRAWYYFQAVKRFGRSSAARDAKGEPEIREV